MHDLGIPIFEYLGKYWVIDQDGLEEDKYGFIWLEEVLFSGNELEYTENYQEVKISVLETESKPFNKTAEGVIDKMKVKQKKRLKVKLQFFTSQHLIVEVDNEDFDLEKVINDNIDKLQDLDWEFDNWEFVNEDEGE